MFRIEHPDYVVRRLEHQTSELKKLATTLGTIDSTDPAAMKDALEQIAAGLAEVTAATGTLAQWIARRR